MNKTPILYKEYLTSKIHIITGLGLVAAFASANTLAIMVASTAYVICWMHLPISKLRVFQIKRDKLLYSLSAINYQKYIDLSNTCTEVSGNNQTSKLQDLLCSYLKMLLMHQSIEANIKETNESEIDQSIVKVQAEISNLEPEQQRLKESKENLKYTLNQHKRSLNEAKENLQILNSELLRLEHEIQLLRANAIANRNSELLYCQNGYKGEKLQKK